ncbi:mannose-ethanolamine phosphotransferase gpi13 [Coemansia sp. Benny D115]|nr:mannose-ethanolamine phosphotransferase gpi13 [Coemansia sp. Benny D115]
MSARGHWIISTMLVLATAVGFWLFSSGFLLTRNVLPNHSQAAVLPFATTSDAPGTPEAHGSDVPLQGGGCGWYEPKFERTIILVIDAMRADFAMWSDELNNLTRPANEGSGKETEALELLPYHNRVPIIGTKCKDNPEQSMLYRFRADPPTTTLQRLKGLTTGQLPTFIDAGSNFAGSAIAEDNWLQAMRWPTLYSCNQSDTSQGTRGYKRNLAFLGDDTWISLFPEELSDTRASEMDDTAAWAETFDSGRGWARVRPFPSLNVWDLDTVDDGVLSRLPFFLLPPEPLDGATENQDIAQERARWRQLVRQKEMLTHADFNGADSPMFSDHVGAQQLHDDWDVIVAHTLGVDHCGHRYGPSHPAISHKLSQMNEMLELVVSAVDRSDKSTVLYVFGDHGMDPKGDHGGDSPREVDAALWVYSNTKWTGTEAQQRTDRVLEATAKILDGLPLGAGLDDDLRKGWWFNTHLSEDYGKKNGVPVVKPPKMRSVPQIDLVSTLSLVLGLHVPFNNLGAVIPELFAADTSSTNSEWGLLRALRLNAAQVIRYLETYMASSKSHGFSDEAVLAWRDLYQRAETSYRELTDIIARNPGAHKQPNIMQMEEDVAAQYFVFLRIVLGTLRQMWAQFDAVLIIAGLSIILVVLVTLVTVYFASRNWSMRGIVEMTWKQSTGGAFAVAVAARAFNVMLNTWAMTHMSQVQATAAGAALGSMLVFSAVLILHTWRHNDNTVVEDSSTLSEHGFMTPVFGLNAVVRVYVGCCKVTQEISN